MCADVRERRVRENAALALGERRPGHEADAVGLHDLAELFLLAEWMCLHLVYGRHDIVCEDEV